MGCKGKGDLYDSTADDMHKLKQSTRGLKTRLIDRDTYMRRAAVNKAEKEALYKEYREQGGRTVSQEAIIAANTPPPVRAPNAPALGSKRPPKDPGVPTE